MDIPQDNPNHTLSVLNHCTKACDIFDRMFVTTKGFQPPYYVRDAVTFHDIGKPYCKTFVNKKGETTEVAHFYDHEHVGAYFVLGMFLTIDLASIKVNPKTFSLLYLRGFLTSGPSVFMPIPHINRGRKQTQLHHEDWLYSGR